MRFLTLATLAAALSLHGPSLTDAASLRAFPSYSADGGADALDLSLYTDGFDEDAVYRATDDLDDGDGRGDPELPGWSDPRLGHGSMLDLVGNGLREPINAIISGKSDPRVLTDAGLRDYIRTIGFSFECLDLHRGGRQRANLGDGDGWKEEAFEYRQTHLPGAPGRWVGSCWESLYGGNHFRAWKQNGSFADTGAWFLAISKEKNLRMHHTIDTDGYNIGRDLLVESAERGGIWQHYHWRATAEWVDGLMGSGRHGINHNISVDGRVVVLTVRRVVTDSEECDASRPESAWTICEPSPVGRKWPWNRTPSAVVDVIRNALLSASSATQRVIQSAPALLDWADEQLRRFSSRT
ncbi:unnamed protein product [Tilletia controversa]|uniref:Uncharacterized protein n=3 Tax=Tilletia TaxID=13289 RepID=A0A8X7MPQ4_9BASI|nr:hypothetical protein CF336_g4604 [Tilletia laevis]KAE8196101.1 hypothetical protein CF328_g4235 [Tilletia controversa]KAE8261172.1 hypothetical protein A4X03_0g3483 [Tilletia caries]KAE8201402.1 hypothetical protein CF335_g3749 [Tilletia laevis]KAE8243202.1 hypothetical protein A4X06_0g6481 [Tilletia controversa]